MKVRIKKNAIRYRLTKSDVACLALEGTLTDGIQFTNAALMYSIQATDHEYLKVIFENNNITLLMPKKMINTLADTTIVGFENKDSTPQLLVEKDCTCLDNVEEDQSDHYPNPLAEKAL